MHALYPHLKGRTSLAYGGGGKYLFTTGENMLVRRFRQGSADEPDVLDLERRTGRCVAAHGSRLAVCCDDGGAELYDVESLEPTGALVRATLPLHAITFSGDGQYIAVVGDDCSKVVRTLDIADVSRVDGDVKHISFHPRRPRIVCASLLGGTVRVLDLDHGPLAEIEAVIPAVSSVDDERTSAAAWRPCGDALALPTKTFEIALVRAGEWLPHAHLRGHQNALTTLEWSPNGRYLASAARDGTLRIWDIAQRSEVRSVELQNAQQLEWHPTANELSVVTSRGQLYVLADAVPVDLPPPAGDVFPYAQNAQEAPNTAPTSSGGAAAAAVSDEELFVSENADVETDADTAPAVSAVAAEQSRRAAPPAKRARIDAELAAQTPFQTGATPWADDRRYLCMSQLGYVWTTRQSSAHHTVTVTFFDQSAHREYHFQDADKFDLAALSRDAVALANSRTGKLAVRFHASAADNWELELGALDRGVRCLALSSDTLVLFTKGGFMRAYALYGAPLAVQRVGVVVACAAYANDVLFVQQPADNTYTYTFEDIAQAKIYQKSDTLEIGPHARLTHLFFSDSGEPCAMDSSQVLATLVRSRVAGQARWVPVFSDPQPDPELKTTFWPLGVFENKLACVLLRGQKTMPGFPLPVTDEFDLHIPGLEGFESQYLVGRAMFQQMQDRADTDANIDPEYLADLSIELDKLLLRQFQAACEQQRISRALQIAQLFSVDESLRAAAQIASAYRHAQLAERILETVG